MPAWLLALSVTGGVAIAAAAALWLLARFAFKTRTPRKDR